MIEIGLIIIFILILLLFFAGGEKRKDDRGLYYRNIDGEPLALMVRGEIGRVPNHENILHDGTPHENPVVKNDMITKWFLFFPYSVEMETRWYPLNLSDQQVPNMRRIRQRILNRQRMGENVNIVAMDRNIERQAHIVENNTQRGKGTDKTIYNNKGRLR